MNLHDLPRQRQWDDLPLFTKEVYEERWEATNEDIYGHIFDVWKEDGTALIAWGPDEHAPTHVAFGYEFQDENTAYLARRAREYQTEPAYWNLWADHILEERP